MCSSKHSELILDQFTRQAVPFATAPSIKDEAALKLVVDFSGAGPDDTVLDVACGPGLIVVAFARVVKHATGIDLTPAMLERARGYAAEQGVTNVTWRQGDVLPLPYADGSFTLVVSRFLAPTGAPLGAGVGGSCSEGGNGTCASAAFALSPWDAASARASRVP